MNQIDGKLLIVLLTWGFLAQDILAIIQNILLSIVTYYGLITDQSLESFKTIWIIANLIIYIFFLALLFLIGIHIKSAYSMKLFSSFFVTTVILFFVFRIGHVLLMSNFEAFTSTYRSSNQEDYAKFAQFHFQFNGGKNILYSLTIITFGLVSMRKFLRKVNAN
jgi:hypothetical protein